ncbi:hypothetical protein GC173_13775 [bacterium]|nr:hypothetical protein [bacterium]
MSIPSEELIIEVFRAGDYGPKGSYTEADLDTIADDYQANRHEAPVTLDHRQDGPAHGWVRSLRRVGDRLLATIGRISPALAALIGSGAYKKRSVELYRRFAETGRPYLKAVSFLGAAAPEVKGLADPAFAESVAFEEEPESRGPSAEQAMTSLRTRALWRPSWEEAGLATVFQQLDGTAELATLVTVLSEAAPPVTLGRTPMTPNQAAFAESPTGASPDSVERHRRALALMAAEPTLPYRDALLRANP